MLEQNNPSAAVYARTETGSSLQIAEGLDQSISLDALVCELLMADIYDGAMFTTEHLEDSDF